MVGQERTILPLLATKVIGLTGLTAIVTYLLGIRRHQGGFKPYCGRHGRGVRRLETHGPSRDHT